MVCTLLPALVPIITRSVTLASAPTEVAVPEAKRRAKQPLAIMDVAGDSTSSCSKGKPSATASASGSDKHDDAEEEWEPAEKQDISSL